MREQVILFGRFIEGSTGDGIFVKSLKEEEFVGCRKSEQRTGNHKSTAYERVFVGPWMASCA